MNRSMSIARLRNIHSEIDELNCLFRQFNLGARQVILEAKYCKEIKWIEELLYGREGHIGLSIRYQTMCLAWPIYPSWKSIQKPFGKPYKERIEESFSILQYLVNMYSWILNECLCIYIYDPDWTCSLESALDIVCTAYKNKINDDFNQREKCIIFKPPQEEIDDISGKMELFKDGKKWK